MRKYSRSNGILNKSIYYYKRNKDSLNSKVGNSIDLKNRFDRIKLLQRIDYDICIKLFKKYLVDNYINYQYLKNQEIKNKIFDVLLNTMKLYRNKTYIYKKINFILHKLSENKIIIFYNNNSNNHFLICIKKIFFNHPIEAHKHIISINIKKINDIKDINNYIYSNDTLVVINHLFFSEELKSILDSHKNNKIMVLLKKLKNIKKYQIYKHLKIYLCS